MLDGFSAPAVRLGLDRSSLRRLVLALAASAALATTSSLVAQELDAAVTVAARSEGPVLESGFQDLVEVSEVFLDVLAVDEDGEIVRGLGPEDFVILEEGEPVRITSVSYYSTRYEHDAVQGATETAEPARPLDEVPSSRFFVFFFHDQTRFGFYANMLLRQQVRAGRAARTWVETEMLPSDWVAIVTYDSALRVHQDFTQDRDALRRALQRAAIGKRPETFRPDRRESEARGRQLSILSKLRENPRLEEDTDSVFAGLQRVAESVGFLVGRKALVLFTLGIGEQRGFEGVVKEDTYLALETVLNDHNVAVYPVDLTPPGRPPVQENVLERLADDTGGFYDPDFSGFLSPLQDVADENVGYYLISYRSERPAGEIGYQRLEITAKDPAIKVRARKGYRYGL